MHQRTMNEFELIASLTKGAPKKGRDIVCGVGDDAAVIQGRGENVWLVTTDSLIEGVHFSRKWMSLEEIGRKALAVNLSDIAAMGGSPRFHLVSIGLPPKNSASIAKKIYRGVGVLAREFKSILIGGDTVRSPLGVVISVTAIGDSPRKRCILRSGARPGDAIYITGTPGYSALGLEYLKAGIQACKDIIERHINPRPRIAQGLLLAESGLVSSMIDVSDGLIGDLNHIADVSGVGFCIDASRLSPERKFLDAAEKLGKDPLKLVLTGGEDYELLFTVKKRNRDIFETVMRHRPLSCQVTCLGVIKREPRDRQVIDAKGDIVKLDSPGFDHFG